MKPLYTSPGSARYVSTRMHGTSAHVEYNPPDLPTKSLDVTRSPAGTFIQSNYDTTVSVHFAIPTSFMVEKRFSIFTALRRVFRPTPVEPVFEGAHLRVVRIELYLEHSPGVKFGNLVITDGQKAILTKTEATTVLPNPDEDEYREQSMGTYLYEMNHEVNTALGIGLTCRFERPEPGQKNYLHLIAAKAVFVGST